MAYARFSSDDYRSDVYVYADVAGGYTVHVAGNRVLIDRESLTEVTADENDFDRWSKQYSERYNELSKRLKEAARTVIEHDLAGTSHYGLSAQECCELLNQLEEEGFNIPENTADNVLKNGDVEPSENRLSQEEIDNLLNQIHDPEKNSDN